MNLWLLAEVWVVFGVITLTIRNFVGSEWFKDIATIWEMHSNNGKKYSKIPLLNLQKEFQFLLSNFSSFLHFDKSRIEFHWSPLHIAAGQGNLDLWKYIFEKINSTQPRVQYKWTALHVAAKLGHEEICEFLIDN